MIFDPTKGFRNHNATGHESFVEKLRGGLGPIDNERITLLYKLEDALKVRYFDWDEVNEDHVAGHGVDPEEVEEVFAGRHRVYRSREGRYVAFGQSAGGRYLMVAYENRGSGEIRVVTARDMSEKEKSHLKGSL